MRSSSSSLRLLLLLQTSIGWLFLAPGSWAFHTVAPSASLRIGQRGTRRRSDVDTSVRTSAAGPTVIRPTTTTTAGSSSTALHSSVAITTALAALDAFWQNFPYVAAAVICGVKASAADLVAQKRDFRKRAEKERKKAQKAAAEVAAKLQEVAAAAASETRDVTPMIYNPNYSEDDPTAALVATTTTTSDTSDKKADWKRNMAFLIYGSLYQGVTQEHIYNHLYPVWFGSGTSVTVVLTKVLFDLLVQTTLVTLPIAYLTKSVIYRYSFQEAIRRYKEDIVNHGLLKKYYLLWGPVQCITFSIIPEHWRVTFIACVSFFWLIILSTIASQKPPSTTVPAAVAEEVLVEDECALEDGLTCNIDG